MHFDLGSLVGLAATLLGTWLGTRFLKPKDHDRALLLEKIAEGAAALVVATFPTASWATLLQNVVTQVAKAAGLPTQNGDAIERAAAAALLKLGKAPAA
jgi:uncharacterized membrane protein